MPLILAVEPDRRQASHVASVLRHRLEAELVIAESAARALDSLADRVPDVLLTSPLLSWQDEAALAARLRDLGPAAAHVQALTIPILATSKPIAAPRKGVLSALRRHRVRASTPDGCEPSVFAEQVALYLERASAEREAHAAPAPLLVDASTPPMQVAPEPLLPAAAPHVEIPAAVIDVVAPAIELVGGVEEIHNVTPDDSPIPVAELPAPIEVEVPEAVETVVAMPIEEMLAPSPVVEEMPPLVVEIVVPVLDIAAPVIEFVTPPAPALTAEKMAAAVVDSPAPPVETVEPVEEALSPIVEAAETPSIAVESPGLATRLREALSVLRRHYMPVVRSDAPDAAVVPEPVASAPVTAPEPALCAAADEILEFAAEEIPVLAVDGAPVPADEDEAWVAVPLDAIVEAPGASMDLPEAPSADEDVWVLTPIPEMEELFVAPVVQTPAEATMTLPVADVPRVAEVLKAPEPPAQSSPKKKAGRPKKKPAQDEWGFFDPDQCGFAALLDKLDQITENEAGAETRDDTNVRLIAY